jgi:hypothetical protein
MNITNTYCKLKNLTLNQIETLQGLMPTSNLFDLDSTDNIIGFRCDGMAGTFTYESGDSLISYTEMMQLLGKAMEFTKSDLIKLAQSETVFVRQRNDNFKIVLGDDICGDDNNWGRLSEYKENLINTCKNVSHDVMAVYKKERGASLTKYLKGQYLTPIWERTEQTPAQKELEELQSQILKLQEQAKVLQSKL